MLLWCRLACARAATFGSSALRLDAVKFVLKLALLLDAVAELPAIDANNLLAHAVWHKATFRSHAKAADMEVPEGGPALPSSACWRRATTSPH